ncbi:MAG: hypothetical protein JNM61_13525 [Zoogloeaceae bacterium]|nr:hypothetical protein [Zoogloeaceae bacterium]
MASLRVLSPLAWLESYCPSLEGQFLFLDPVTWETYLIEPGAKLILDEAARAIEDSCFDAFVEEINEAGGWPPELEFLARGLATLSACPIS